MSKCLYLLAVLANLERNHSQAKALLEKAQLLGGDEQFWYNSTLSLTEAILEEEGEGKQSMVRKFLGFGDCGLGFFQQCSLSVKFYSLSISIKAKLGVKCS